MADKLYNSEEALQSPARDGLNITPNDSTDLAFTAKSLYVGGTGDVKITTASGAILTFPNVQGGSVLPWFVKRLWATGTTATGFVTAY